MIRKTLTYLDYEGKEHTKDFYFSLNQTEFALMNNKMPGGFEAYLKQIEQNHNEEKLLEMLVWFIEEGYGVRMGDDDFIKEDEVGRKLGKRFRCTEACDNLITELLTKENNIGAFLVGMLPESLKPQAQKNIDEALKKAASTGSNVVALPENSSTAE